MSTFKGVVCTKLAKDVNEGIANLQVLDVQRKPLGDSEVRIRVHATSLNFFDLLILVGKYQQKPKIPFVVASEASGEIIEVGKKVKHLKLGDAVLFGMTVGALGEEVVVNAGFCLKKPPSLTHKQAAGLFVGFSTAYNGLIQRGNLKEGEYCLVTGSGGGMGASAIQVAKKVGAIVIAAASSDEKLAVAKKVGADHIINYSKEDMKSAVEKITNGKFCNVIYDVVGGEVFDKCIRCIGDEGRLLVIGFASGTIPKVPANIVLVKGFSVVGVRAGESMRRHPEYAMEMYSKLLEWCAEDSSKIAPYVEHTYSLDNYKEAFKLLNEGKVVGKAVIEWIKEKPVAKL